MTSQPQTTILTAQQQQALAQIAAQQQSLPASQQTNVQIEHSDQTGGTNQIGVNQFKTSWCCATSFFLKTKVYLQDIRIILE